MRVLLFLMLAVGAAAQPYTLIPDIRYDTILGVDPERLSLDVYRPAGTGPFPIVVFVHGGAWTIGDKRQAIHAKADWLTARGILLVSVNYRLSPAPTARPDPDRVRSPTHARDVGRAVAFVRANAASWGGDAGRIAMMGHSAGAHLATLVTLDASYVTDAGAPPNAIGCVVSLDTNAYDIPYYLSLDPGRTVTAVYENAFTDELAVQIAASPITWVGQRPDVEALLVRQATPARAATTARFRDALSDADHSVSEFVADGLDHEEINQLLGSDDAQALTEAVEAVLDRCLSVPTSTSAGPSPDGASVAPNPTASGARLRLPPSVSPFQVRVFDVRGRLVRQVDRARGAVRLDGLAAGVYTVVARSRSRVVRQRLVVSG